VLSLSFPESDFCIAAMGSDLKQCIAVSHGNRVHVSDAVSDLMDAGDYVAAGNHARALLHEAGLPPNMIACDAHPDAMVAKLATELAGEFGAPVLNVQHHHAHIASVVAEHALQRPTIGLALDGFGYGADGGSWGGECLLVSNQGCQRLGRLKPLPLPGGDQAARQPWRMAAAALSGAILHVDQCMAQLFDQDLPVGAVLQLCLADRTARSSSAGRYFDAASAIITGITVSSVEAEAAIKLEQLATASDDAGCFSFQVEETDGLLQVNLDAAFAELVYLKLDEPQHVDSLPRGDADAMLARRFHNTLIAGLADLATQAAEQAGVSDIAFSGGCFFNRLLMAGLKSRLSGFHLHHNKRLTPGDGNISTGQAWVALQHLMGAAHAEVSH